MPIADLRNPELMFVRAIYKYQIISNQWKMSNRAYGTIFNMTTKHTFPQEQ